MKKIQAIVFAAVVFVFGLSFVLQDKTVQKRELSSEAAAGKRLYDKDTFFNFIAEKKRILADSHFYDSDICQKEITEIFDVVYGLKISNFDEANIKSNYYEIIKALFDLRIEIRKSFQKQYFLNRNMDKTCVFAHRKLFRGMRGLEDFVGMVGTMSFVSTDPENKGKEMIRAFQGKKENLLWNTDFKPNNDLEYVPQSGDVLLSRGSATVSAAIARITDEDSNFSHIGMVYVDPKTKKVETIEAHIEYGVIVADFAKYRDNKVRSLVFRFNDPSLTKEENAKIAHEAAEKVRQQILDYRKKYKNSKYPNVCYDFTMNLDNPIILEPSDDASKRKCIFCSEVVSLAFSTLAKNKYRIPTFFSDIKPKNRKFIDDIGVTVDKTFAPADIEIDPYFDLVLEWRDYKRIHFSHHMDAILTAIFSWMDDFNYQYYTPKNIQSKINFAYGLRRIPILDSIPLPGMKGSVKDKFPLNLSKSGVEAMFMLDLSSITLDNLIKDTENSQNSWMTFKEIIQLLNDWRAKDQSDFASDQNYGTDKDSLKKYRIHEFLRAPKSN